MALEESRRRSFLALDPSTRALTLEVQISFERMQTVGRRSLGHAKECGLIVPEILERPTAIFEGLKRDEDEDPRGYGWRCYCGRPVLSFRADGSEHDAYPGQVYLVFVNDDGIAYNWRWERADDEDADLPRDHAERFQKRLL
jgi:hypothetical protein